LLITPLVVAVISTVTVQVPDAGIVPPVKVRVVPPAAGVKVGEPHPAETDLFGVGATSSPEGSESVNPTPVNAVPLFGFVIVNVRVDVSPTRMGSGAKLLLIEGGAMTVTVS
jgi:hypothetical protein